jgi:hypothetical protein
LPGSEHHLILALAVPHPEPGPVRALLADSDPERLTDELLRLRLLGLLGSRLGAIAPTTVDPRFAAAVESVLAAGRRDAGVKQFETFRILRSLGDAGISAVPLKGPFLAERLHGDVAMRLSHDIDVLVTRGTLRNAVATLEELGYVRPRVSDELPKLHHIFGHPELGLEVELHWRVHWNETGIAEDVVRRSQVDRAGVRHPDPVDDLILLLLMYARDGLIGLRTPVDIGVWWDRHRAALGPDTLRERLAGHPTVLQPVLAAVLAARALLGVPTGSGEPPWPATRRTRMAVGLADWRLEGSHGEAATLAAVVDGLLSPARQLPAYAGRQVFPALPPPHGRARDRGLHGVGLARRAALMTWARRRGVSV